MHSNRSGDPDPGHDVTGAAVKPSLRHAWSLVEPQQRTRLKQFIVGGVITLVVLVPAYSVANALLNPATTDTTGQEIAPVAPNPVLGTTEQQVRKAFGPWHIASPKLDPSAPILLISPKGVAEAGKELTMAWNEAWKPAVAPEIRHMTLIDLGARLTFGQEQQAAIEVASGQIFIFADAPDTAYSITPEGQLMGISTTRLLKGK